MFRLSERHPSSPQKFVKHIKIMSKKIEIYNNLLDEPLHLCGVVSGIRINGCRMASFQQTFPNYSFWKKFKIVKREYDSHGVRINDTIVYVGERSNNQSHGLGCLIKFPARALEDDPSPYIQFFGYWDKNKRSGRGLEFFPTGHKKYDGEWRNDQRNGRGASFCEYMDIDYFGQWKNGQRHGHGTEYWNEDNLHCTPLLWGRLYEGGWKNGMRHGKGREYWFGGRPKESSHELPYLDSHEPKLKYEGTWDNGKPCDV